MAKIIESSAQLSKILKEDMKDPNEILTLIEKEFGTLDLYFGSTYITPKGYFLNPEISNDLSIEDLEYEHSDFLDWMQENGIEEEILDKYCIKINSTWPYIALPTNPLTQAQITAIQKLLANYNHFSFDVFEIADEFAKTPQEEAKIIKMKKPLILLSSIDQVIDLNYLDIKEMPRILKNAQRGILYENLNMVHIKQNLVEDTRVTFLNKSKNAKGYKNISKGKNRFERKRYSRIVSNSKQYNHIDMDQLFKEDILIANLPIIGETSSYVVTLKIEGVIEELQKNIKNNNNKFEFKTVVQAITKKFNTGDVYAKCNCPDFLYNFAHYMILNNQSVDGTDKDPGPGRGIRNPNNDKGVGCKHIMLVLSNGNWMMKVASVINNYCHYMAKFEQPLFLKIMFPKLYGVDQEDAINAGLIDDLEKFKKHVDILRTINRFQTSNKKAKKNEKVEDAPEDILQIEDEQPEESTEESED